MQNSIPTFDVGLHQVQGSAQPIGACDAGNDLFADLFAEIMSCVPAAEPAEIPLQGWSDKGVVSPEGPGVLITPSVPSLPTEGAPSDEFRQETTSTNQSTVSITDVSEQLLPKLPEGTKESHVERAVSPKPAASVVNSSVVPTDDEIVAQPPSTPSAAPRQPIVSRQVLPKANPEVTTKLPLGSIRIEPPNPAMSLHHLIDGPMTRPAEDADVPAEPPSPPIRIERPSPAVPTHHLIVDPIVRPGAAADAPTEPPSTPISIGQPDVSVQSQPSISPIAAPFRNTDIPVALAMPANLDFALHDVKAIKVEIESQPAPVAPQPATLTVLPATIHMPIRTLSTSTIAAWINRQGSEPVQPQASSEVRPTILSPESFKISVAAGDAAKNLTQQETGTDQETHTQETPKTQSQTIAVTEAPVHFEHQLSTIEESRPVQRQQELPPAPPLPVARRVSIEIGENDSKVMVTLHEHRGDVSVKIHAGSEQLRADLQSSVGNLVEAFQRERVSLANMDFTSGYATSADPNHQRQNHPQQRFQGNSRKNLRPELPFSNVEILSEESSIRILA